MGNGNAAAMLENNFFHAGENLTPAQEMHCTSCVYMLYVSSSATQQEKSGKQLSKYCKCSV